MGSNFSIRAYNKSQQIMSNISGKDSRQKKPLVSTLPHTYRQSRFSKSRSMTPVGSSTFRETYKQKPFYHRLIDIMKS